MPQSLPQIGRQHRRGEDHPLIGERRLVPCSRLLNHEGTGPRHDRSGRPEAVLYRGYRPFSSVLSVGSARNVFTSHSKGVCSICLAALRTYPDMPPKGIFTGTFVGDGLAQQLIASHLDRLPPIPPPGAIPNRWTTRTTNRKTVYGWRIVLPLVGCCW